MGKLKLQFASSSKAAPREVANGCTANSPLAATVHDIYRKFGLCECVGVQRRA